MDLDVSSPPHLGRCEAWDAAEHCSILWWRDACLQWLCAQHISAPCSGCALHDTVDRSVVKVYCDRCRKLVPGDESKHFTCGFYRRAGWAQFFNDREERVCDKCMFADPRYTAVYGKHAA